LSSYRLGVDIGGTFTDFALLNESTHTIEILKLPTTPRDPAKAVIDGVRVLSERLSIAPASISYFVHGTTLAVNTLIERSGARAGLFVTRGFEDLLELRRLRLPDPQNFFTDAPIPLVERSHVRGIDERMAADGRVKRRVALDNAVTAAAELVAAGCTAIAVCFLHAYANDAHEREVKAEVSRRFPDLYLCTSSEVWPQRREYERALLTTINAHVGDRMRRYFRDLEEGLRNLGVRAPLLSTKSNGGVMTARTAGHRPVETLFSGPASGVIGAHWVASHAGFPRVITFDMGGTSADVSVVTDRPVYSTEAQAGDFPVLMPSIDVKSVGAGGGSVAWIDPTGVLKVGPRSAGSTPGPACYGRGGEEPTITDAYMTLGWINPNRFAGGGVALDPRRSHTALARLGARLGLSPEAAAWSILEVATANMYARFTPFLTSRGVDAEGYAVVAFGGAGPTHACLLARDLGLGRIIVPEVPGALCALGCLVADFRADFVRVFDAVSTRFDVPRLEGAFGELEAEARAWLVREGLSIDGHRLERAAEMRYVGQSFEVFTPLPPGPVTSVNEVVEAFFPAYQQVYGYVDRETPIQITDLRVQIVGVTPKPRVAPAGERRTPSTARGPRATRKIVWEKSDVIAGVYDRAALEFGETVTGPAVIEQDDTTTVVPVGFRMRVDAYGNLIGEAYKQ
jgi:N-methylhydantoinase A